MKSHRLTCDECGAWYQFDEAVHNRDTEVTKVEALGEGARSEPVCLRWSLRSLPKVAAQAVRR